VILAALAVVLVALVAFRLALPSLVRDHVNRVLDQDPDYDGSIGDVDISLIQGEYAIHDIQLRDTKGDFPVPLFAAPAVHFSVSWRELFRGALVGEIDMDRPQLNIVNAPAGGADQDGTDADWRDMVLELFPLRIDRLGVVDGELHYVDPSASPVVDVYVSNFDLVAHNLTNSDEISESLAASVRASGEPMGFGNFVAVASFDPYADLPTFDLNLELHDIQLVKLNDFLKAYGKFDAESGLLDAYVEIAADDGRFTGYVKPVLRDVKVVSVEEEIERDGDGPIRIAWEAIVGAVKGVFTNEKAERQLAAKVPISGSFEDPKVHPWRAVVSATYNAFVNALFDGLDQDVQWQDAPGRQG
jgi:hypothetical protein